MATPDAAVAWLLDGTNEARCNQKLLLPLQDKVKDYFSGLKTDFSEYLPTFAYSRANAWPSSRFACDVLKACANIGYGERLSYGELAKMSGHPKAGRAVGNILGKNNLPLIIPCHRVIRSDGSVGGFMQNAVGGAKLKQKMLNLESI